MQEWPLTLPQTPLADNLNAEYQDSRVRYTPSWGIPIQRNKFSAVCERYTLTMYLTLDQVKILRTFYLSSLSNGTAPFSWKHPLTKEPAICRFYEPFQISFLSAMYFTVTLPIEILP